VTDFVVQPTSVRVRPLSQILTPSMVGTFRFELTPLMRRGYDPAEVEEFRAAVADLVTRQRSEIRRLREELERKTSALRRWQADQAARPTWPAVAPQEEGTSGYARGYYRPESPGPVLPARAARLPHPRRRDDTNGDP
jgi:DivIVA domain-containing protein